MPLFFWFFVKAFAWFWTFMGESTVWMIVNGTAQFLYDPKKYLGAFWTDFWAADTSEKIKHSFESLETSFWLAAAEKVI